MKKLFVLTMALALVALFALPALAQVNVGNGNFNEVNFASKNTLGVQVANDVNGNGVAQGNTSGSFNTNTNQFNGANLGDQSDGFINKSTILTGPVLSGNTSNIDNSQAALLNKSTITTGPVLSGNATDLSSGAINKSSVGVAGSFNGNRIGGGDFNLALGLDDSLNNNEIRVGNQQFSHQYAHQFEHQYDHQINLPNTFNNFADGTVYLPISNVHLEQVNTDVSAGANAGATTNGISQAQFTGAAVAGMVAINTNMGGVGTNQAALNVVTAFSASPQ